MSLKIGPFHGVIFLALLFVQLVFIPQGEAAMQILLAEQQPLVFAGNMTFVVENVDSQAGKVWVDLYGENGLLKSDIMGVGSHFTYLGVRRIDLSVSSIYAGGEEDLVKFVLHEGVLSSTSLQNLTDRPPKPKENTTTPKEPEKIPGMRATAAILSTFGLVAIIVFVKGRN